MKCACHAVVIMRHVDRVHRRKLVVSRSIVVYTNIHSYPRYALRVGQMSVIILIVSAWLTTSQKTNQECLRNTMQVPEKQEGVNLYVDEEYYYRINNVNDKNGLSPILNYIVKT